jgi:hypothetical protein
MSMATRALIVAARNTTAAEYQAAFPDLGGAPSENDGWTWGVYSLWAVDPSKLEPEALSGPVMIITTSDDSVWFLRAYRRDSEPFGMAFFHELLELEDLDEDSDFRELLVNLYDMVEEQLWPPPSVRQLKDLPTQQALPSFLGLQAEATAEALTRLSVPHDRQALLACLDGGSVTDEELESPVGNLPCFLESIGLTAAAQMFRAEEEPEEDLDDSEVEAEDSDDELSEAAQTLATVLTKTSQIEAVPMTESVSLPAQDLYLVWLLAWFCDMYTDPALTVRLPGNATVSWPRTPIPRSDEEELDEEEYAWQLCIEESEGRHLIGGRWGSVWRCERWLKSFGRAIAGLPDGTEVTIHAATSEKTETPEPGTQVYQGHITNGELMITATFPAVSPDALQTALALASQVENKEEPVIAVSEAEAKAVIAAAERSGLFFPLPKMDGLSVSYEQNKEGLVSLFFRERFRGIWPVEAAEEEEAAEADQIAKLSRQIGAGLGAAMPGGAKADQVELVHEGRFSRFRRATSTELEGSKLDDLSNTLDSQLEAHRNRFYTEILGETPEPAMAEPEEEESAVAVEKVMQELQSIGFAHLGDLICESFAGVVIRCFGRDGDIYACVMLPMLGPPMVELYTVLEDETSLTTTTNPDIQDLPHREIYYHSLPDASVQELLDAHSAWVVERTGQGKTPVAATPTLEGMAAAIDDFLVRRMGM